MRKCFRGPLEIFTPLNHGFLHIWSIVIAWVANLALQEIEQVSNIASAISPCARSFSGKMGLQRQGENIQRPVQRPFDLRLDDNLDPKDGLLFGSMWANELKARGLQYTPHYTEKFMGR